MHPRFSLKEGHELVYDSSLFIQQIVVGHFHVIDVLCAENLVVT